MAAGGRAGGGRVTGGRMVGGVQAGGEMAMDGGLVAVGQADKQPAPSRRYSSSRSQILCFLSVVPEDP